MILWLKVEKNAGLLFEQVIKRGTEFFLPQLKSWLEKVRPTLVLAESHWRKNFLLVYLFLNKSCCIITSELKVCWGLESYKIAFLKLEIFLANGDQSALGCSAGLDYRASLYWSSEFFSARPKQSSLSSVLPPSHDGSQIKESLVQFKLKTESDV